MTHTINTEEAPNKWWAAKDRSMKNIANASHYTDKERTRAIRMQMALELVYQVVFTPSYGKNGITVKAAGLVKDRPALRALEQSWAEQGIQPKMNTRGEVLYRFKKA